MEFQIESPSALDDFLEASPEASAVFLIAAERGAPYLGRTTTLRRRLKRLLGGNARLFSLRDVARSIEFWPTGSRLETNLIYYRQARRLFPQDYTRYVRLAWPSYVKLILTNEFPRTQVTSRLTGGGSRFFGPFRTRASAEAFDAELLSLFQIRRCQEDLLPSSAHPGCMYGEMNLCLRPCQEIVTVNEYSSEVRRVEEFLKSKGRTLLESIASARNRASEEMEFEEARRQHIRHEKVESVLKLRDELAHDLTALNGVAVVQAIEPRHALLIPMIDGWWQETRPFALEGAGVSMDARLRLLIGSIETQRRSTLERQEHLALLSGWFYSSSKDEEWVPFSSPESLPYRKLVRAISNVARA